MMFNGELIKRATSTDKGGFLHRVSTNTKMSSTQKIHLLFKSALAREATADERRWANKTLQGRGNVVDALQDAWWVVLNTNEFILNH
jgi:hypothetical protein